MTPEEFYRYIESQFNLHRDNGIRDLNEGNANPGDQYTAALTLSEEMVHHVFGNTDHFELWCREHGLRMTAREGYGQYRIQREYRARRVATPIALDPVLGWNQDPDTPIAIAETVEWTLTDIFHRPDQDTVHIGLGYGDQGVELAQGGYLVPEHLQEAILNGFRYDTIRSQPIRKTLNFTKLIYEDTGIHALHQRQEKAAEQTSALRWAESVTQGV